MTRPAAKRRGDASGCRSPGRPVALSALAWLLLACAPEDFEGDFAERSQLRLIEGVPASAAVNAPNDYLQFVNQQANVPVGDYVALVVPPGGVSISAVSAVTAQGSSPLTLARMNACPASVPPGRASAGGCYALRQPAPGGLQITVSPASNYDISLLDRSGRALSATLSEAEGSGLSVPRSRVDNPYYAEAYYNAVDPQRSRRTLPDWLAANGFGRDGSGCDVHVVFRDVRDLGYGRNMCMRQNADGSVAFWVRNYFLSVELPVDERRDNDPGAYGNALSLEAAIDENSRFHVGTNAIEFSPHPRPENPDAPPRPFAKFFTFTPSGELDMAPNLDGRGAHAMPGACIVCHNGVARSMVSSSSPHAVAAIGRAFRDRDGDVDAKPQVLEVPDLGYSDRAGFTRADLEPGIRRINMAVYCTYPGTQNASVCQRDFPGVGVVSMGQPAAGPGEWGAGIMRELLEGWYGGRDFPSPVYVNDFVPTGWRGGEDPNLPEIARNLFLEVVGPHCIVCHGSRGQQWRARNEKTTVDFSTYDEFLGYEEQITSYVFELGIMPLSLQNFSTLFAAGNERARETLSSVLSSFDEKYAGQTQVSPGAPFADAGPPRRVNEPRVILRGDNSRYADSYRWRVLPESIQGPTPILNMADQANAELRLPSGATTGTYTMELVVSRGDLVSARSLSEVEFVDEAGPTPGELRFYPHVRDLLQQRLNNDQCISCHAGPSANLGDDTYPNIPVWFTDEQPEEGLTLYEAALEFVDFRNVRWSEILLRGAGYNHVGGERAGFDVDGSDDGNASSYHMLVNWILNGALEGTPP